MKKLFLLPILSVFLFSCVNKAELDESVVVEQINILEGQNFKYEIKLKTAPNSGDAYYYTNFRHQVGDTLVSYYEFFEGKDREVKRLRKTKDSLERELDVAKYYLQILKEKVIISDTLKKK